MFCSEGTAYQEVHWGGLFGAISAGVALALYGVASAVEGVVLKQAADAWANAPAAEQVARFASAEAIRWPEWGIKSYQSFTVGFALVLFRMATIRARVLLWMARQALWLSILVWRHTDELV